MRWLGLVALCFVLFGCPGSSVSSVKGAVERVGTGGVVFPDAWVGGVSEAQVRLRNTGKVAVTIRLTSDVPFSAPPDVELPGGAQLDVTLRFSPTVQGAAIGELTLDDFTTVQLAGTGLEPPVCLPSAACVDVRFDPSSGTCQREALADGTVCASSCLVSPQCLGGACVGTTKSCDDGNPCTADACEEGVGCTHPPKRCPPPSSPCLASMCDPAQGCTEVPVPDGTSCGSRECLADVCVAGECVKRPSANGAPCGDPSPCQALGTCQDLVCIRPSATPLAPEWIRSASADARHPPVDEDGNIYFFVPGSQSGHDLVSVEADGTERFVASGPVGAHRVYASAIVGGVLIAIEETGPLMAAPRVHGYSLASGQHLWVTDVTAAVAPYRSTPTVPVDAYRLQIVSVFDAVGGQLGLAIDTWAERTDREAVTSTGAFIALRDPAAASIRRIERVGRGFQYAAPVVDATGRLTVSLVRDSPGGGYSDYGMQSVDGQLQLGPYEAYANPVAVADGRLLSWSAGTGACTTEYRVSDARTLIRFYDLPALRSGWRYGLTTALSGGGVFDLRTNSCQDTGTELRLWHRDAMTGTLRWERLLEGVSPEGDYPVALTPLVTKAGTVLLASGHRVEAQTSSTWSQNKVARLSLRELGFDGRERFSCPLSVEFEPWYAEPFLSKGRWIIYDQRDRRLLAFPALDRELADDGWLVTGGNLQRTYRER